MKHKYLIALLIIFASCKNKEAQPVYNPTPQIKSNDVEITHIDTAFEYETRTGTSSNYTYNYDVFGTDENENEVSGTITTEGKYGMGTLLNSDENEIEVEVEWVGYGKLKAIDDEGNEYGLEVSK